MINKKILAASIAATFAFNANAVIDLNTSTTALTFGSEKLVTDSKVITANAALNFKVNLGAVLPVDAAAGGPIIRFELTNATFGTAALTNAGFAMASIGLVDAGAFGEAPVGGGTTGTNFVAVEIGTTTNTTAVQEIVVTMGTTTLLVGDATKPVTIKYSLYAAGQVTAALNGNGTPLSTQTMTAINFASGQDRAKSFTSVKNTALVAKEFKEFKAAGGVAAGKVAGLGVVKYKEAATAAAVKSSTTHADVTATESFTDLSKANVTGDFSFGTWHMSVATDCSTTVAATTSLVVNTAMTAASVPELGYVAGQTLCVTVDGVAVIPRNSAGYAVTLTENDLLAATIGSIVYDTTNITVPYLTTFDSYNQRVYILNNGTTAANYTTTFQTETGTTADAGTAATGTVPAKTLLVIKASDMVTFTGSTRGAAVIEIEASTSAVEATTQTVNVSDSSTDTLVLAVAGS